VVRASAAGLKAATLELQAQPIKVSGGLGLQLAADALPSYLGRGPTPDSPSFKVSRRAAEVSGATAQSNAEAAGKSFDDDETTSWVSGSGAGQAWIAYQLARPATLTDAHSSWPGGANATIRRGSASMGQEVFKGATPKSFGYVTLPLKAVSGRSAKIELIGIASDNDSIKLVEVANQANVDIGADRTLKGVLAIVEAEFYEAVRQARWRGVASQTGRNVPESKEPTAQSRLFACHE
jgi:beta-galactosidase